MELKPIPLLAPVVHSADENEQIEDEEEEQEVSIGQGAAPLFSLSKSTISLRHYYHRYNDHQQRLQRLNKWQNL